MIGALIYFVTPKPVLAKAYLKNLLNKHGYYYELYNKQLLE